MKRWVVGIIGAVIIGVGIYSVISLVMPKANIPAEFSEARINGAELAREIVALSNESLGNLETIAAYDRAGKKSEALILISQEVLKNRNIQQEAIKLSSQLERMARSINDINPTEARVLATEAVSSEVALVSRLLSYNDYLLRLFEALRNKFENPSTYTNGKVEQLVVKINEEAQAINTFNQRFTASLAQFDKLF
jgi:hypothetical protein